MAKTPVSGSGSGVLNQRLRVFLLFQLSTTFAGIYRRGPQPSAQLVFILIMKPPEQFVAHTQTAVTHVMLSKPNVTQLNSTQPKATVKATSLG